LWKATNPQNKTLSHTWFWFHGSTQNFESERNFHNIWFLARMPEMPRLHR